MARASEGHSDFDDVFRRYVGVVRRYCASRLEAVHVEDAVQETFLSVLESRGGLPSDPDRVLPWLIDRARTACKKVRRSASRAERLEERAEAGVVNLPIDPVRHAVASDELDQLLALIGMRKAVDGDVVRLTMLGYSNSEIASMLGVSRASVRGSYWLGASASLYCSVRVSRTCRSGWSRCTSAWAQPAHPPSTGPDSSVARLWSARM